MAPVQSTHHPATDEWAPHEPHAALVRELMSEWREMLQQESGIRTADLGRRAIALVIDTAVFLIILIAFAFCVATVLVLRGESEQTIEQTTGPLSVVLLLLYFFYYAYLEARWGQTVGKRMMRLRVVTLEGAPIGWRESLIRNAFRGLDGLFYYLVGLLVAVVSAQNQRIGDHVAGTLVVPLEEIEQLRDPDLDQQYLR